MGNKRGNGLRCNVVHFVNDAVIGIHRVLAIFKVICRIGIVTT